MVQAVALPTHKDQVPAVVFLETALMAIRQDREVSLT
jgi:hypothetical protein